MNAEDFDATGPRGPGQRAGLTRGAVLDAARTVLSEGGAGTLTMRGLARRLEVAPNALYSHVSSRDDLLDALLDDVLGLVGVPSPGLADPLDGIRTIMTSTYSVLIEHAVLVPVFLVRQGARGVNAVRLGVLMDAMLRRAGVEESAVAEARRVLIVHTIGFAAFSTAVDTPVGRSADPPRAFLRSLDWLLTGMTAPRSRR
ncbi:AcrR family transcriptional regulator [Nakamurella sp. UYEF19]|uniref:TetR/AcrR family transcriptional regulator n=1 Tax=Nakamurella sp. UYEF19 TaxID=1756392 RepID=UPI003393DAE9